MKKIKYINYNILFFIFFIILVSISIIKDQQNNTSMEDLGHIRDIKMIEIYNFKSVAKFNDNYFLMEVKDSTTLGLFEMLFLSSKRSNNLYDESFLNDIASVYPLKVFISEDDYYLIYLFLNNNKEGSIMFYGNERLYNVTDYELIIELKEMLDI